MCHERVINHDWYQLGEYQLDNNGHCAHCHFTLAGVFDGPKGNFGG